jgi:hypothetical protein
MKLVAAIALFALTGCPQEPEHPEVSLYGITKPPPASVGIVKTNRVDEIFEVTLSQGVALAVTCTESCREAYGSCVAPQVVADDPDLLGVRPVYRLNGGKGDRVLVAKQVGTTMLRVTSTCGTQPYVVHIEPRPTGSE